MPEMKLTGADLLDKKLLNLEQKTGKKVVRKAVTQAAKPVLKKAQANAARMVGGDMGETIFFALQSRVPKGRKRKSEFKRAVQHDPNEHRFVYISKEGKRSYIPSAIEYGHGNAKPIPYMRKAISETRSEAERVMIKEIKTGVEKEARVGG